MGDDPSLLKPPKDGGTPFGRSPSSFRSTSGRSCIGRTIGSRSSLRGTPILILEAVQPFHGGSAALWILHELAAQYRHHLVHPAIVWPVADRHRVVVGGKEIEADKIETFPKAKL